MKRIVVYQSSTGFTEKYARWIAEELRCDVVELKKIKVSELEKYDAIIYGGYIMANMVSGYDKLKKLNLKNLVVFGVGMTKASEETRKKIAEQNEISQERFFYFEGGYNPQKLGFVKRMMMNMIRKSIEQKEEKTSEDIHMLESFHGVDNTNREFINPLLELVQKMV